MDKKNRKNSFKYGSSSQNKRSNSAKEEQSRHLTATATENKVSPTQQDLVQGNETEQNILPDRSGSTIEATNMKSNSTTSSGSGENNLNTYPTIVCQKSEFMNSQPRPSLTSTNSLPIHDRSTFLNVDARFSSLNVHAPEFTPKYYPKIESANRSTNSSGPSVTVQSSALPKHTNINPDCNNSHNNSNEMSVETERRTYSNNSVNDSNRNFTRGSKYHHHDDYRNKYGEPLNDKRQRGKFQNQNNRNRDRQEGHKSKKYFDNQDETNHTHENWDDEGRDAGGKNLSKNRREMEPYDEDSRYRRSYDKKNETVKFHRNRENRSIRDESKKITEIPNNSVEDENKTKVDNGANQDEINDKHESRDDGRNATENKYSGENSQSRNRRDDPSSDKSLQRCENASRDSVEGQRRRTYFDNNANQDEINKKHESRDDGRNATENKYSGENSRSRNRRDDPSFDKSLQRCENAPRDSVEGQRRRTYFDNNANQDEMNKKHESRDDGRNETENKYSGENSRSRKRRDDPSSDKSLQRCENASRDSVEGQRRRTYFDNNANQDEMNKKHESRDDGRNETENKYSGENSRSKNRRDDPSSDKSLQRCENASRDSVEGQRRRTYFDNNANQDEMNKKHESRDDGRNATENKYSGENSRSRNRRDDPSSDKSLQRCENASRDSVEGQRRRTYFDNNANQDEINKKHESRDDGRNETENKYSGENSRSRNRRDDPSSDKSLQRCENAPRDSVEGQRRNDKQESWDDGRNETENKFAGENSLSKTRRESWRYNEDIRNRSKCDSSFHHNRERRSMPDEPKRRSSGHRSRNEPRAIVEDQRRKTSSDRANRDEMNDRDESRDDRRRETENKNARDSLSKNRRETRHNEDSRYHRKYSPSYDNKNEIKFHHNRENRSIRDKGRRITEITKHKPRASLQRYENETRDSMEVRRSETSSCSNLGEEFESSEVHLTNELENKSNGRNVDSEPKYKTRRSYGGSSWSAEKRSRESRSETRRYSDCYGNNNAFYPDLYALDEVLDSDVGYTAWVEKLSVFLKNVRLEERDVDLFTVAEDYALAHCVAADMSMGSGIALQFRSKFRRVGELLDQRQEKGGLAVLHVDGRYIYYLVTKDLSSGKPTYLTMYRSLVKLRDHMAASGVKKLAIPRIGCGLDRLGWSEVKSMITCVFDREVEIVACSFEQNTDLVGPPKIRNCKVVHVEYPIEEIEPGTIIVYLASTDNYMSEEMTKLDEKFNFLPQFKTARKELGEVIFYEKQNYVLCGCVVKEKQSDEISFKSLQKCVTDINKRNHKQYELNFVGFQVIDDEKNSLNYSVINLLRNGFRLVNIYICWPGEFKKLMPVERNRTSSPT